MTCFCTGRCRQPPYTCNGGPPVPWIYAHQHIREPLIQEVSPTLAEWLRGLAQNQRVNKPRIRVKAEREVIA